MVHKVNVVFFDDPNMPDCDEEPAWSVAEASISADLALASFNKHWRMLSEKQARSEAASTAWGTSFSGATQRIA